MALRQRLSEEQPSTLAGWLFADLFLLLFVVGLSGIVSGSAEADTTTTLPPKSSTTVPCVGPRFIEDPLKVSFNEGSVREKLVPEIERWLAEKKASTSKTEAVVVVLTGWATKSESEQAGQDRIKGFYRSRIKPLNRDLITEVFRETTATHVVRATRKSRGDYSVDIYFADFQDCD